MSRLLVKSNNIEPAGKVAKLRRVKRCVIRVSCMLLVSPEEMSLAKLDSSLSRIRQIWH